MGAPLEGVQCWEGLIFAKKKNLLSDYYDFPNKCYRELKFEKGKKNPKALLRLIIISSSSWNNSDYYYVEFFNNFSSALQNSPDDVQKKFAEPDGILKRSCPPFYWKNF